MEGKKNQMFTDRSDTFMCLQNRELLALPRVLAFPNASKMGFVLVIFTESDSVRHKKSIICFPVSVFPEPVTPVINIDCCFLNIFKFLSASFA